MSSAASKPDSNNVNRTTAIFGAVALGCVLITGVMKLTNRAGKIEEYGKNGQEFYPEFNDPTKATSLSVSTVTKDLNVVEFSVEQAENGRWVIPSHHNYPTDAKDRLANTASSVIGIKRGGLVTRWASDHTRYGVVDPSQDSLKLKEVDGVGKRLTLLGKDDAVLCSFIVGKPVEGETGQYYVRHPKEDETYITDLSIDLSTKFKDWVETDLLDINNADVRSLVVNDYTFDAIQGTLTQSTVSNITREKTADPWVLKELDDDNKEVNKSTIDETVNTLGSLAIVGVRPKQRGLKPDLTIDRTVGQREISQVQDDLLKRGYLIQPAQDGSQTLELLAKEGELAVGIEGGIVYKLYFGRAFTGSDEDLEIGLSADAEAKPEDDAKKEKDADDAGDDPEPEIDPSKKPGRYLFVRVLVDETLVDRGPVPVKPEMSPELLEAQKAAEAEKKAAGDEKPAEEQKAEAGAAEGDKKDDAEAAEPKEQTAEEKYKQLKLLYDMSVDQYDIDKKAYEDSKLKVDEAQDKANELNRRFEQWYYVIPGDSYDKLALKRDVMLKDKESTAEKAAAAAGGPRLPAGFPSELNLPTEPAKTVPKEAEPMPTEVEPMPKDGDPAPKEADPTPKEADPTPKEADPARKEADPAPKEADSTPKDTPKEADSTPKEADPAPKEADPTPKEADPTPKEADPKPKEADPANA